jgi:LuxR family transcriptional regulator, maltose regulon positive regulatory protein
VAGQTSRAGLVIPRILQGEVRRQDLVGRLQPWSYRLALVVAPPGFGKTTLLADWARREEGSVVWLSCNESHFEPSRFWTSLTAALRRHWPEVGDDCVVLLERGGESVDVAISLANALGEVPSRVTLVVDDLHLARPTPHVLRTFVQALPENARLVVGSRVDPPFSLARLRSAGQMLDLRESDLRFSLEEAEQLFAVTGVALSGEELRQLHEFTEGWPAGLRMTGLVAGTSDDRSRLLGAFSGTGGALSEFLVTEVLDRLAPDLVEFMLGTCVLDSFDRLLCVEMTGREDAHRYLNELREKHLFLAPIDAYSERFRYHHLFGEFLRAQLKALGANRWSAAHLRAAGALLARGDTLGAVRHAMEGGDTQQAARTLRAGFHQSLDAADAGMTVEVARAWLYEYGQERVVSRPMQVIDFVTLLLLAPRSDEAVWWLQRVEEEHPVRSLDVEVSLQGTWVEYFLSQGQADRAIEKVRLGLDALERLGRRPGPWSAAPVVAARTYVQAGDYPGARRALTETWQGSPGTVIADKIRIPAFSAYLAACAGELTEAEAVARGALRLVDQLELPSREAGRIVASLALAVVKLERNERDEAGRLLDKARRSAEESGRPSFLTMVTLEQAQWFAGLGDLAAARGQLANARLWLARPSASVEQDLAFRDARFAVQLGDDSAAELLAMLPPSPASRLLRARHAVAEGNVRGAEGLLEGIEHDLTTRRERVELMVLRALASLGHDLEHATVELSRAVALGQPEWLVRAFVDLGPGVSKLLAAYPADWELGDYVRALRAAADAGDAFGHRDLGSPLLEPLTVREVTVLRYLSSHLTNVEIASLLYVSVNTLKSHIKAIYRKLEVESRPDAVKTGRALHLF